MLDKATHEWLERRKTVEDFCCTICDWEPNQGIDCDQCWPKKEFFHDRDVHEMKPCCCNGDYKDASEFNARVAVKLAHDVESYFDIVNGIRTPLPRNENAILRIKSARLLVEQEMIREGKGPGSPEDA